VAGSESEVEMLRNVRRVIPLIALAAVAIGACTPVKPSPPPGRSIAYYYVEDFSFPSPDTGAFRSTTPGTRAVNADQGVATQTLLGNGSVVLQVSNAGCCGAASGFYTGLFRLGDLTSATVHVSPGSTPVELSLAIDVSGNGEWGEWDANGQRISFGGDEQGIGPVTSGGHVVINDFREFQLVPDNSFWTLGDLKAGAFAGIDENTKVALLVNTVPDADATTTAFSLELNGVEQL
jgi:hypothetical protein